MTQSYKQITGTYDFGSIVRALQVQIAASGAVVKEYPYSFQGITEAIQGLTIATTQNPGADIGPKPSMGEVTIDSNGDPVFTYSENPLDGDLWFDTRQGRLFIAFENQWYQTNGADGLSIVTSATTAPAATNLAIGQFWFETTNGILYIFAGQYEETDGTIVTTPTATTVPVWAQLVDTSFVPTTATLQLTGAQLDPKISEAVTNSNYLPFTDPALVTHQDDVNLYYIQCLLALDDQLGIQAISQGTTPPANPVAGQLWFDTDDIELSIWYIAPGASYGQWVPTFSAAELDSNVTTIKTDLATEISTRATADNTLQTNIDTLTTTVSTNKSTLQNGIDGLQAQINAIPSVDLSGYVTTVQQQTSATDLQNQISGLTADVGTIYTKYGKLDYINQNIATLQGEINNRATSAQLTTVQNSIPSLTGYATTAYVNTQVAGATGFSTAGDTITGTVTFDKADIAVPGLDFSTNDYDGRLSHKYRTNCQMSTAHYATFGTTDALYEYEWAFDDNEDFCWTHGTNGKVASIDKTGIAATNYYIATFGTNTSNGRYLTSTIDVGARLQTTKTALESLRTNAALATTLDELKSAIAIALANV